jgi:multidrug efflux pump subunit AcrA (membrane-fusion protein)
MHRIRRRPLLIAGSSLPVSWVEPGTRENTRMGIVRNPVWSSGRLGLAVGLGCMLALVAPPIANRWSRGASPQVKPHGGGAVTVKAVAPAEGKQTSAASSALSAGKPPTARVEKRTFKIEVVLSGVFESQRMTEVSIRPKAWAMPLLVDRAVELGTPVKKGDILVELDHEKIDKTIADAEVDNTMTELALRQAAEELPILEKALPVDLTAAERSRTQADEDLKRFLETDRPQSVKLAEFSVKRANEYLEYTKEELRQLEKMYRSKDLTEETEEIILRRQRFQVENSEFALKEAELHRDQTLKVDLPRQEQRVRETAVRHAIDLEKARATLPLAVNQKRLALARLKHDLAKAAERLADLRNDRDAMTVHTAADGLVYYGHCDRGQWTTASAASAKLRKGGMIMPDEVFITIVAPRPLAVRASIDEKDLAALYLYRKTELKGNVTPTFDADRRLVGRLTSILPIPREAAKFEAVIAVEPGEELADLKPGMACSIKFVPYRADDALTLPATAISDDDGDGTPSHYVYLARSDRSARYPRRRVTPGKTANGRTEIKEGLVEGDEVLLSKP